jgi:hypothetical protein
MSYESYLSHHGIKGQKWGVENGPPYPLNDVVKAIAYKGGDLGNGKKVENFTEKDVRKARKIVDRNLKTMSDTELQQYKARIMLEQQVKSTTGKDTGDKLVQKLKSNAVDMVADSIKTSGKELLTNAEKAAIVNVIEQIYGPDVAAMISNGVSAYDIMNNKVNNRKTNAESEEKEISNQTAKAKAEAAIRKTNAEAEEKELQNAATRKAQEAKDNKTSETENESKSESTSETKTESAPKSEPKPKTSTSKQLETDYSPNKLLTEKDHKYIDKKKVNGEWQYEYDDQDMKLLTQKADPYKKSQSADNYVYRNYLKDVVKKSFEDSKAKKKAVKLEAKEKKKAAKKSAKNSTTNEYIKYLENKSK